MLEPLSSQRIDIPDNYPASLSLTVSMTASLYTGLRKERQECILDTQFEIGGRNVDVPLFTAVLDYAR